MQNTDNRKNGTNNQLPPDHYNIRIPKHARPMALVYLERLPASLPDGKPAEADGEAQRSTGDDQVTSGNLLRFVVGREEGYHAVMSFVCLLSSGREISGDVFHVMLWGGIVPIWEEKGKRKKGSWEKASVIV